MIKNLLKKTYQTRIGLAVMAFIAGGIVTYLFTPEKIKVEIKTETVYVDKIVEKEVVKYVEKEVIKYEKVRVVKRKTTWPDGKVEEEEIYESESEQIDRMQEKYEEMLVEAEKKWEEKYSYLKEHTNPKRFNFFGGAGLDLTHPQLEYLAGINVDVWGPITTGLIATSGRDMYITFGLKF